ncbi:uncharacterized protein LOC143861487 [Tasmannia lanceolata]|uniref:uncharacterized protein LOC143861487 n=1 Tax=Tasmannia lanceolata TaxID=3420 RepID=UPI0040634453
MARNANSRPLTLQSPLSPYINSGKHMDSQPLVGLMESMKDQISGLPPNGMKQPFVIGVAGGTASGKTTVCDMIIALLRDQRVVLVNQYQWVWCPNTEGCFLVRSFFWQMVDSSSAPSRRSRIWKSPIPPRIAAFAWTVTYRCIKTCDQLKKHCFHMASCGESMENALRACCKGIKIGKILIHRDRNNGRQLIYEKLPEDISGRHVLLLDPILATGNSAVQAISLLISKGVPESNIIFLNLISAPEGIHAVCKNFPTLKIVTSEIDTALDDEFQVIPGMGVFGDRYFGTDKCQTNGTKASKAVTNAQNT